jgi:hypothetical protein
MPGSTVSLGTKPRIFWFDSERQLSFGWSGRAADAVCVLAHTNLSQHEFVPPADLLDGTVVEALRMFETACRNWQSPYWMKRG